MNLSDQGCVATGEYENIATKVGVGILCRSFVGLCLGSDTLLVLPGTDALIFWSFKIHI